MTIHAREMDFKQLNRAIRGSEGAKLRVDELLGQRYIGAGLAGKALELHGVPGNAMGAYMDGATIRVCGNAQDAVGDTMNEGRIVINGSCGDALGYAMRGGSIYVRGNVGYRCGIHMKAYEEKQPVIVIGGCAGSFLGEYQAGGRIVVLGIGCGEGKTPVGDFIATGMHGGSILLRTTSLPADLPEQVTARVALKADMAQFVPDIKAFCKEFGLDAQNYLNDTYYLITPDTANPYKRLYVVY